MPQSKSNKPSQTEHDAGLLRRPGQSSTVSLDDDRESSQQVTRRGFVGGLASMSAFAALSGTLTSCASIDEPIEFRYGVASGDPLTDRVILWTHVKPVVGENPVDLQYQVASDIAFTSIITTGFVTASSESGFTVKVDAKGLRPGRSYFYRFRRGEDRSPVGTTRTLPDTSASEVR
ncbi:MAG: hypothetical protein EBV16_10835, partial [Betaproteobacteria bacterium]|nr:hypothetical protein [Betaproteobacteria bacterium]